MDFTTHWAYHFFNSPDYLALYQDMTTPWRTGMELDFCEKVLRWRKDHLILDAPCGAGRHGWELARRGYTVVGLDFSSYLLTQAQGIREPADAPPRWVRGLMQRLPFRDGSFDFVICLFSSFGYGDTEEENLHIVKEYARVLRPGGKVLIDVMNRHFVLSGLNQVHRSVHGNITVSEYRTLTDNQRRLHNRITVHFPDGTTHVYDYRPWMFNGWELSHLVNQANLRVDGLYGNFQAEPYHRKSERAMLVAVKPA
ncbi:MAG TPA: methyltransferase domain-containing protein [bacterium]|nr:methyltransferase domain-containing protein [Candidatus Omnitrophota bacterium]HOJ61294.1 methyltransferase domain-containing protein [bacterium]HPP01635.1 methyltransferase domain-containing protein [bacterium]HXK95736.1 methyltransferase domain-containing protein [bacterium]